jgi:hypothetical protein
MSKIEFESTGRSMRWYEWLAGLLLLGAVAGVRAGPIYKCIDGEGGVAYQDIACLAPARQWVVPVAAERPVVAPPRYAIQARGADHLASARAPRETAARGTAYECRTGDGRTFYRLSTCPHTVAADPTTLSAPRGHGGKHGNAAAVSVSARRISREDACHEIHRAGAIGRDGHELDEHVSTYDRNLGRDPCK